MAALVSFALPLGLKEYSEQADLREIQAFVAAPEPEKSGASAIAEYNKLIAEAGIATRDPWSEPAESLTKTDLALLALVRELSDSPHLTAALLIPAIDLKIPVYYGTSEAVLSRGSGVVEGTFVPTGAVGEHSLIAAHRGTYYHRTFHDLGEVQMGDQFVLINAEKMLSYEVVLIRVVPPYELNAIQINEDLNLVTLVTCDPIPTYINRLLVTGKLISSKPLPPGSTLEDLLASGG